MKMKHMLVAMVLLLGLVLGNDAFAHYNPSTGRWLNRDPIAESGGFNLYLFVRDNPVTKSDKLGLFPFCNHCKKLNEVIVLKEEWEIGTPDKTAKQIKDLTTSLQIVENLETGTSILEIVEGNPSILFPKPDISDQGLINNLLAFQPVNAFGRVKYKVCQNVGPRFFFFGSYQLDLVQYTEGWDPSDKNQYDSGQDAVDDAQRFIDALLVEIKEKYPDAP